MVSLSRLFTVKPRIERMVDLTKKTNENVELVCRYSGEGDLKAKFVFEDQEYAVRNLFYCVKTVFFR